MWSSSLTRDRTRLAALGVWSSSQWTTRQVLIFHCINGIKKINKAFHSLNNIRFSDFSNLNSVMLPAQPCLWLDGSTIVLLAVMAVQEAISAFGPAWIARSFQTSWRAAGLVARALAHTKIEVSVNAYAVVKVQRRFFSPHFSHCTFLPSKTTHFFGCS